MEYNKQQFTKTKDKKVLHKVKKQWVVVSLAMLAMLGGGAMAKKVSAHADVNSDNNANNGAVTLKDRLNQSLSQAHKATLQTPANSNNRQNDQNNANANNNQRNINVNQISQQANVLHKRIIRNANFANANQSTVAVHSENGRNGQQQVQNANRNAVISTNGTQKEVINAPQVGSTFNDPSSIPYTDFNNMNLNNINPSTPKFQKVVSEWNSDFEKVNTSKGINDLKTLIGQAVNDDVLSQINSTKFSSDGYFYSDYGVTSVINSNITNPSKRMGNVVIYEGGLLPTSSPTSDLPGKDLSASDRKDGWNVYFDARRPTYPASSDIDPKNGQNGPSPLKNGIECNTHGDALINNGTKTSYNYLTHKQEYTASDIRPHNYGFEPSDTHFDIRSDIYNPKNSDSFNPLKIDNKLTDSDEMHIQKYLPNEYQNLYNEFEQSVSLIQDAGHTDINSGNVESLIDQLAESAAPTPHTAYNNADNAPDGSGYVPPFYHDSDGTSSDLSIKSAHLAGLNISYMYGLFQGDKQLQSIDMRGFHGSDVVNMNAMLQGCSDLTYLNLQGLNLSRVRDMRDVFHSDRKLKTLNLQNVVTSPYVFSYDNTFENDSSLSSVNLSGIKTVIFKNSDPSNASNNERNIQNFIRDQNYDLINGKSLPDPSGYGIKHIVSDMTNLFKGDSRIQRLRMSSDTIFVTATGDASTSDNWGLFGDSPMIVDIYGNQINPSNETLMTQYNLNKANFANEGIFDLIYPSADQSAKVYYSDGHGHPDYSRPTHDYEYFAATQLPFYFDVNFHLIPTTHIIDGAIDGKGHQTMNGVNYYGNASDGFEPYEGASTTHKGLITKPLKHDNNIPQRPINRPNGYSDFFSDSYNSDGNVRDIYKVNDKGVIDNLIGKPEDYKVYLYQRNRSNPYDTSHIIFPISYDGTNGRNKALVGSYIFLPSYNDILNAGYHFAADGVHPDDRFLSQPVHITSGSTSNNSDVFEGPDMIYGGPNSTYDLENSDNPRYGDYGHLREYDNANDPTANYFKIPVDATKETIPVEFYIQGTSNNISNKTEYLPSQYTGKTINNAYGQISNWINSNLSNFKVANSDKVASVINSYKVGETIQDLPHSYGVTGGNIDPSTQFDNNGLYSGSIYPIRVPVQTAEKHITIKYVNELSDNQSLSDTSHLFGYTGNTPNLTELENFASSDNNGLPSNFYVDSNKTPNISDNGEKADVYVLPHVYNVPVQLKYKGNNEGTLNANVSDPQDYGQSDSYLISAINGYLSGNGNKYVLPSLSHDALSNYSTGKYIDSDGVTGGNLVGYNLASNNAGNVNTLIVPVDKPIVQKISVNYVNEFYQSNSANRIWKYNGSDKQMWVGSPLNPGGDISDEVKTDGVPDDFHIDSGNNNYVVNHNSNNSLSVNVNVEPDCVYVPIKYHDMASSDDASIQNEIDNQDQSYVKFQTSNDKYVAPSINQTNHKIESLSGFPTGGNGYETYPQNQYEFKISNDANGTSETVIPVIHQTVVAEGDWDLDHPNDSALFKVLSDGSGDPHNDTLVLYSNGSNKVMHTSSWSKAGYSDNGAKWVFPSDGSDTRPNALNRDSISKVEFQGNVQLPSDNASSSVPYSGLFQNMHYLTSVDFNDNTPNASNTSDMSSMFSDDPRLTSLDLSKLNVSKLSDASNMFAGDSKLSDLTLSTTKTNNLHHMSGMFTSDTNLKGTTFQNKYVHGNVVQGTNSINNINNINTQKVSDMSDVFESDTNLINLDLSSWSTPNASDMDAMFANDPKLQHLDISQMTTKNVYPGSSDQMFQGDFCASDSNYSDNPNAKPKQNDYAIVMNQGMHLGVSSSLIGYWASPDYKNDPGMFSPRQLDREGANLGYLLNATWIKQANNLNDLTAETFRYYNQMNSLVGSAKTTIPKNYNGDVSPYNYIQDNTPSGYQLPPSNSSLTDMLLHSNISNPAFTSFSNIDQRVNVLGDVEESALPVNVTEDSKFNSATKHINVWGYYGDFKDSLDGDDLWYSNATNYKNGENSSGEGPDQYYKLNSSSNDSYDSSNSQDEMYFTLSSGNYSSGTNNYSLSPNNKTNIQWQNNSAAPDANQIAQEPVLDYVNMVANDVKIQFVDQNGNTVHTDGPLSNVHIGQIIDLPHAHDSFRTPTSDAYHNYGLPAGYTMDSDQPTSYKILNNDSTVNLYVTGAEETAAAKVNLVYEDSDGNNVSDITSYPVQLSGHVDNIVDFNPLTITPKTGYQLDADKTNSFNKVDGSFPARLKANNSSNWVDPRNPSNNNYHYPSVTMQDNTSITNGEPTVFFKDVQAVLTTVYINQSGNVVGSPDTIEGTAGNSVNVTDPKENGEAIPQGYILDGGDNKPAGQNSDVIGNNQDTQYTLNAGHHTVYLHVNGESDNDAHVRVLCVLHNRDHSTSVQSDNDYDLKNNTDNGKVHIGDVINVNPSDPINKDTNLSSYLKDNHYDIAPSDQSQPVTVVGKNQVSPQTVIFNYDQNSNTNKESITYHFYDQDTNQEVSSGVDTGKIGQSDNPTTDDNYPNHKSHVPNGYQLADGSSSSSNYNYTFSNVPQDVWIPVKGQSKNNTFTIYQIENHLDHSRTVNSISIPVSYDIGQSFHVSPYGFNYQDGASTKSYIVPGGYHADPSDQDMDVQVKSNGQLSRSSVAYSYSQDYQPSAIGAVEIHYITGTPNDSHQEIDKVSDHGLVGDNFILRPYYDDLPDTIADGYQSTGNVYGQSGEKLDSSLSGTLDSYYSFDNGVTKFRSGSTPNIYIQVEKING